MPKLTSQQERFVLEYASNGGNATAAAKVAGYSEKSAHEIGRQQLEKPHVREAIMRELMRLRYRSGAVALQALVRICEDEKAPAAARVAAARTLAEHSGLVGTAKEIREERDKAETPSNVVDFHEVLAELGKLNTVRKTA